MRNATTEAGLTRRGPSLGGLNLTVLRLEVRRMLRNRRTLAFTLVMPATFFLLFALPQRNQHGAGAISLPYTMISMAVYAAMVGATSCGAAVAVERSVGWTRALRLTPMRPAAHIAAKAIVALVVGLIAVGVEYTVGAFSGVQIPLRVWLLSGLAAWLGSLVFAVFGLFVGFLLPSENVMQFIGPLLALLAVFGGLFLPISMLPDTIQTIAAVSPVYGISQIARSPLVGGFGIGAVVNVVVWLLLFSTAATWLYRRDVARA